MRFAVCFCEPPGSTVSHCWYDLCRYISYGLERLGHDSCILCSSLPADGRIPIVISMCHQETMGPAFVDTIRAAGTYILFLTEIVSISRVPSAQGYSLSPPEATRTGDLACFAKVHLPLMRHAAAVWTGAPSNLEHLAHLGVQADHLPGGYLPEMHEVSHKAHKDIDFLYYGNNLQHKMDMIERLRARGAQVVNGALLQAIYRNDLIARTRVHLVPARGLGQDQFGWAKSCYLLNQRSLIVAERTLDQEQYQDCFLWSDTDHWVDLCLDTLHRPDRDQLAADLFDRFTRIRFEDPLRPLVERFIHRQSTASVP